MRISKKKEPTAIVLTFNFTFYNFKRRMSFGSFASGVVSDGYLVEPVMQGRIVLYFSPVIVKDMIIWYINPTFILIYAKKNIILQSVFDSVFSG